MPKTVSHPAQNPQILEALDALEQARRARPDLPVYNWETAERAANTLLSWQVPATVALAALLAPLLKHDQLDAPTLAARYDPAAADLAGRLLAWRAASSAGDHSLDTLAAQHSLQLRRLFRQVYLDLPGLPFILLLLADHDARFAHPALVSPRLAARTDAVFIPLTEMLGLWALRRDWIDRSMAVQFPAEYKAIEDRWLAWRGEEKSAALAALANQLIERMAAAGLGYAPQVRLVQPAPGTIVYHVRRNTRRDEIDNQVTIRVLCASAADCYRVLGVVHGLGKPVAPRFSERFADYIAAPPSTGYRALHTAITYKSAGLASAGDSGKILVEFRILTPELDKLNEWGVVTAFHRAPDQYRDAPAWWNEMDQLTDRLRRHFGHEAREQTIERLLAGADLGSHSNPLYVFTPRGEIVLLDEGSTPIDFAFHIHKDWSRHTARVEVNGQGVLFNYPLRNGDLVQVHADPRFDGPDLSWLSFVATRRARTAIRKGLTRRARAMHQGRSRIEAALIRQLEYYADEKQYRMAITTRRLETFLLQFAHSLGLADLPALYVEVDAGRLAPEKIVRRLLSAEMAEALIDAHGERPAYALQNILLCEKCRPVPGELLLAVERRVDRATKGLLLHRAGNEKCGGVRQPGKQVFVRWAEPSEAPGRELALFEIAGADRHRLLEDVIEAVYQESGAYLYRVEGQAYRDGGADINLAVEADSLLRLAAVGARIEAVPNVHQVLSFPPSPSQRLALKAPAATQYQPNPYATQEVYDRWMFYDREGPIREIRAWLAAPLPAQPMILHGQRRVGKSSLARYLMHEVVPQGGLALPIFVDLQALSLFGAANIANFFVQAVYRALPVPAPARAATEEPMHWLDRAFRQAVDLLGKTRLLVMIDEFNVLLDMESSGKLDPAIFANLRAMMNERRDVNWMLILQDTHFRDPDRWGSAGPLFQQTTVVALPHLDSHWAGKLILEPARRCGILYAGPEVPQRILELTAGSPYLIQVLCYTLVDRVRRQNRTNITTDDLRRVVDLIGNDGHRYFAHFTENLTGPRRVALAAVAAIAPSGEWVGVPVVLAHLGRKMKQSDPLAVRHAMDEMERQGMLALRNHAGAQQVRIPMQLFHDWVKRTIDLDTAIAAGQPGK